MKDKYNPKIGEIWWFETVKKHFLIVSKDAPSHDMLSYRWLYKTYCLETGEDNYIYHENMNAHGEGWFRRISPVC
jgi:hypothetical protein